LFLDEIGELDWDLQSKLLRVIQERCVLPVGDDRECPVDVRIVAASHRNLASLVDAGRFREDLFYRLSVVRVHLPPLRERREDVAPLAFHFAGKHAELHGGQVPDMDPDFLDALSRMQFLGNVRELENLIRVALTALDDSGPLSLRELPRSAIEEIVAARRAPAPTTSLPPSPPDVESLNLSQAIDACERSLIVAALARCQGSQVAAAKLLGVTPRTVFNKVHRHGIEPRTSRSPPSGVHAPAGRQKRSHG
jgi:transcriptional regulator with GAF, ATPase, and Fis domain